MSPSKMKKTIKIKNYEYQNSERRERIGTNEVKEDGSEEWKFESSHEVRAKSIDTTIFWLSLYAAPVFWGVFFVLELIGLKLMWTLACLIGFILTGSNAFGYYKCSGDQKKKIQGFLSDKTNEGFKKILQLGASALANNK